MIYLKPDIDIVRLKGCSLLCVSDDEETDGQLPFDPWEEDDL